MEPTRVEQLLDMAAVHSFYAGLLQDVLGHPVPVPNEVATSATGVAVPEALAGFERWLNLLDLAITPLMVRDALREPTTQKTAESLLRHFVRKRSRSDPDRDKTDFIVTFLYRSLVAPDKQVPVQMMVEKPSEFEQQLCAIIGSSNPSAPPEEHRQLVREFPYVCEEVDDYHHFDQLMDSGVIQRVREIKQRFGDSFYHPRVLSIIAAYNVYFGSRFDALFKATAEQIKKFAIAVQQQGASIMTRVDGDITVQHLAQLEQQQSEIMQTEYSRAQESFRRISKFKKAVDSRTGVWPQAPAAAATRAPAAAMPSGPSAFAPGVAEAIPAIHPAVENGKLKGMEDSIRNFIVAADPRSANVVPLRNANIILKDPEVDAFRADYSAEKSFRADYAGAVRQAIAIQARIQMELQDFKSRQDSAYLWKPHADSLAFLISAANKLQERCGGVLRVAEQRGLVDKAAMLNGSLQKMREQVQVAARALERNGTDVISEP